MVVQWAPLSTFDAHSHFVVSVGGGAINITVDVHIDGGNLNVTNLGGNGNGNSSDVNFDESQEQGYRCVNFASSLEFELYMKNEIERTV